jgi:hypothetical protein
MLITESDKIEGFVGKGFFDYIFPADEMKKSSLGMAKDIRIPLSLVSILVEANGNHVIQVARYGLQVIGFVGLLGLLGLLELSSY